MKLLTCIGVEFNRDRLLNFEETVEMRENPSGGAMIPSISYRLTRTGFTLLAMRFTGKRALAFQLAYIDAFDAMAAYIKNQRDGSEVPQVECRQMRAAKARDNPPGLHYPLALQPLCHAALPNLPAMTLSPAAIASNKAALGWITLPSS